MIKSNTIKNENTEDMFLDFDIDFLTSNQDIKNLDVYKKIKKVCARMVRQGVINMGTGYCLSMSEMIMVALKQQGIKSKLVECSLTMLKEGDESSYEFVGFNANKGGMEGFIDTHVVVITETDHPILIDASISHRLPRQHPVIIDSAIAEPGFLGNFNYADHKLKVTYQEKKIQKISWLHQESIIDRIGTDKKIFDQINVLKKLNYVGIGLSIFAVIAVINQFFRWFV